MKKAENKTNLGLRATNKKHMDLKRWALDHGTSVQAIFDKLTDDFLSGKQSPPLESGIQKGQESGVATSAAARENPLMKMLEEILDSENAEAISAVQQNLRVFYMFIGQDPDDVISNSQNRNQTQTPKPPNNPSRSKGAG